MFRPLTGFKAHYHGLTLIVVSEFDEWRTIAYSPEVIIQGTRQFTAVKAKDHAVALAKTYFTEIKQGAPGEGPEPDWQATGPQDWLVWKA